MVDAAFRSDFRWARCGSEGAADQGDGGFGPLGDRGVGGGDVGFGDEEAAGGDDRAQLDQDGAEVNLDG
jgi:hypothetical protein